MSDTSLFLLSFGGPRRTEDIPIFLASLMRRTVPPELEQAAIARYQTIGGFSPLPGITERQADAVAAELNQPVKAAFRYCSPSLEERINEAYLARTKRLVFFVMTPFDNDRTVGDYKRVIDSYLNCLSFRPDVRILHGWYREPLFVEAWRRKIGDERLEGETFYLFSAHSLPRKEELPYRTQVEEAVETIAKASGLVHYALAWQSVPPSVEEEWIRPPVKEVVDGLSGRFQSITQVPVGFVSDHLETLYDIDHVHREYALSKGFAFHRVSSLNDHPLFIKAIARIAEGAFRDS